jgi:septum formation topological specificity factor MinE
VVAKYVAVKDDMIRVKLGKEGSASVLEINVELGDPPPPMKPLTARAHA